jgi:MSHA pilin protein MshD
MRSARNNKAARRAAGIAEVLICTVIVGMLIVSALDAAGMVFRTQRLNSDKLTGPGLAQDLLAEIMSMPYTDPQNPGGAIGVDSGESAANRTTFDDVDDYHNLSSADAKNKDGTSRTGYTGWAQAATVAFADVATGVASGSTDTGLKRITVTVTSPTSVATQLVGLRFKEGALEQGLPVATITVSWVGVELRAGTSTRSQFAAAPLANLSPDAN